MSIPPRNVGRAAGINRRIGDILPLRGWVDRAPESVSGLAVGHPEGLALTLTRMQSYLTRPGGSQEVGVGRWDRRFAVGLTCRLTDPDACRIREAGSLLGCGFDLEAVGLLRCQGDEPTLKVVDTFSDACRIQGTPIGGQLGLLAAAEDASGQQPLVRGPRTVVQAFAPPGPVAGPTGGLLRGEEKVQPVTHQRPELVEDRQLSGSVIPVVERVTTHQVIVLRLNSGQAVLLVGPPPSEENVLTSSPVDHIVVDKFTAVIKVQAGHQIRDRVKTGLQGREHVHASIVADGAGIDRSGMHIGQIQ